MEKILIISPGGMPVPAVKGGAVQNLIEHIIKGNEKVEVKVKEIELYIATPIDEEAKKIAENKYPNTKFIWVSIPKIITFIDNCIYGTISKFLKKTKAISFRNNFKMMWYSLYMSRYIRKNDFSKIIIENNLRLFWIIKLFKNEKKYNNNYYLHLHNIPRGSLGCKKQIHNCKKILCISDFVKKNICGNDSKIGNIENEKVVLFRNCIDLSVFNTIKDNNKIKNLKEKYNIDENDKVIIFTGRISKEKGILETIKACNNLNMDNLKLLIVGSTFYNSKMKSKFEFEISELAGSNKNIIFTGYVDYDRIKELYQIADIAVLPSMWDEPAGLTMIEAMACGIPVISTKSGGIPEYLHDNCAILLDRDENIVENIEKSIIELLNNKDKVDDLIEKGLKVASEYDSQDYYNNFFKSIGCG